MTAGAPTRLTVYVPSGPPPWPTTLIAIEAIPLRASVPATAGGAPFFQSPNPWPKIATGQPPRLRVPAGRRGVNWIWFVPCGTGVPVAVLP